MAAGERAAEADPLARSRDWLALPVGFRKWTKTRVGIRGLPSDMMIAATLRSP